MQKLLSMFLNGLFTKTIYDPKYADLFICDMYHIVIGDSKYVCADWRTYNMPPTFYVTLPNGSLRHLS